MIKRFFRFLRNLFQSTSTINSVAVSKPPEQENITTHEPTQQKEVSWFTRKNNLVQEFAGEAPVISSSNFDHHREEQYWVHTYRYKGYVILAVDLADLHFKSERIDHGDTDGNLTIDEFDKKYGFEIEPEELLADDVATLKNKYNPSNDNNTYEVKSFPSSDQNLKI